MRVALLIGTEELPEWFVAALERMVERTDAELSLVVHTREPQDGSDESHHDRPPLWTRTLRHARTRSSIEFAEMSFRFVFDQLGVLEPDPPCDTKRVRALDPLEPEESVECEVERVTDRVSLPSDVVDEIAARADVALHYRVGILTGDVLSAPAHGVLGFHPGNLREHRGSHGGLWQLLNDEPTITMTLQWYNETLDGGEIVDERHVDIADATTWSEARQRLYTATEPMLEVAVNRLLDPDFSPIELTPDELGPVHLLRDRTAWVMLEYFRVRLRRAMLRGINLLVLIDAVWRQKVTEGLIRPRSYSGENSLMVVLLDLASCI